MNRCFSKGYFSYTTFKTGQEYLPGASKNPDPTKTGKPELISNIQ
jgi:hypothetical protein